MVRKGSETSASKRYPLRPAYSSGRVLRSASTKNDKACSEALNDSSAAQPAVEKGKTGSPSGSHNNSVRVLRSAVKDKEACSEPLNDSTADESAANKRKCVSPTKLGSSNISARVLRSASKNKDEASCKPLNDSTAGEPAANKRKCVSPSKVGSPNNSARVLRCALKTNNEASSGPLIDGTVAQPSAKKRRIGSPSKVGSPVSSARVLRSTLKTKEACNEPQNSASAQPAVRKVKSGTPSRTGISMASVRVLRSASKEKNDAWSAPVNDSTSAQPAERKRKSGRASKEHRSPKKEYLKICQRVRYVLNRMNYEQSLIQAYASEGWKGQSSEKIKPEKELERAKAEILRCKLRIREAFHNMDSLLSEGKLEDYLFDSAGEISSEDIFCAICGSKDVTLQNDIILCDGACDRGFHQNCLNPPLLTKDIPPGDEGWLCPACVCKVDCVDALNELQGSKLSIHDSWEKVFPEAASLANGSKHVDASDLPLDDSENNHYNPAFAEGHRENEDRPSAEDEGNVDDLGLPSEDSEDDDFDPAGPESSEDPKKDSNSEDSDFTSDSDDFCVEIAKSCGQDEVSVSPLSKVINHTDIMKISAVDNHSNGENSNHAFMEMELEQDTVLPVSSRRQVERLDYKKLYDEAYGKESSDSSDDDEWSGKEQLEGSESDSLGEPVHPAKRCSRRAPAGQQNNEHTPQRERLHGSVSEQQTEVLRSNGSNSTARKYRFGPIISEKLKVHFEKDPYPSRAMKESLAQELGLTYNQVCRWFSSTRHYTRVASAKKEKLPGNHTTETNDSTTVDGIQVRELNAGVMEKLTADRNMVSENLMVQSNLNECNKEDIPLSGTEIEMESYGKESSDSSDEEWSVLSTPQRERLEYNGTDSLPESLHAAKRCSRRAPAGQQNSEHTQSKRLHGSASEQQTEILPSNSSSSTTQKYHFGPMINQKLKVLFEKDPYPSRVTKESLAQELGLTFNQVNKWFSATRHYSRVAAAKNKKHPGKHTAENNDSKTVDSIQVREPSVGLMGKPTAHDNDMISKKMMVQINLNEGNEEDIPDNQYTWCKQRVIMTPTNISREIGPPGYGPGENYGGGSRNTSCEQSAVMTPTTISREVGPPGYVPGENQGDGGSRNTSCKQSVVMNPTIMSREVGPPGYGPGENLRNSASWDRICKQRVFISPITISREIGPPGYGPGENQGNDASWNTSCGEQRMFTSPTTISREVGPPGYEPVENQGNGASWNTSCEQGMSTPTTISRDVGPPGYGPVENQGTGGSRNISSEQRVFMTPTTISREVYPPGYGPGESQGNGASRNVGSPKGRPVEKVELSDEARKKAIMRELRRRQKFR